MTKGKVVRPAYGSGDGALTLTASITKGTVTKTKVYNASVKEAGMTDNQCVMSDLANLKINGADAVRTNITLPTVGTNGSAISWASDKDTACTGAGIVTRPANGQPNATVVLTATIEKGTVKETKPFTITVLAWTDAEEVPLDAAEITWEAIKNLNVSKTDVTTDLKLPVTGTRGSTITWVSSAATVITTAGKVTRPDYTTGDMTVSLTANVTKNSVTIAVYILGLKVTKLPITNLEAVTKAISLVESSVIKGTNPSLDQVTTNLTLPKTIGDLSGDCSSIVIAWAVTKDGKSVTDNPNMTIITNENNFTAVVKRPASTEANAVLSLEATFSSSSAAGSEFSANNSFTITILKVS
jgi:hypothetical protein